MKIRQGFVSNSSSSSFVLITKKDAFDEALKKWKVSEDFLEELQEEEDILGADVKEYLYQKVNEYFSERVLFGVDTYVHHDLYIQGCSDYSDIPWAVREEFEAIIESLNKDDVFSSSKHDG